MPKEFYVKPEVRSEILELGALCSSGSSTGDNRDWILGNNRASISVCCEEPLFP
jgi:hypothetical protein